MTSPLVVSRLRLRQTRGHCARAALIGAIAAILAALSLSIPCTLAHAQAAAGARLAGGDRSAEAAGAALERMARDNFGALSEAELKLVHAAPRRALLWVGPTNDINSPANDPAHAGEWPPGRTIRAALIRWLAADPAARPYVHPSGVGIGGARIDGQLDLSYMTLASPLTILSSAIPDGVDFSFAHVPGLDLSRSTTGPIVGDRAAIGGDLIMTAGNFGPTSLFRAEIDGSLDCSGARFVRGDDPLSLVEATIKGDASFHAGFTTSGVVDMRLAEVERGLSFNHARFVGAGDNGLNAERAKIDGTLYWVDITRTPRTELDLANARAGALWDDAASWPAPGRLFLEGFMYGDISGGPADAPSRLKWLALQPPGYRPQPYGQLARVLRERGSDLGAVSVLIAKEDARRRQRELGVGERLWGLLLDATIGYGYRPIRALWWIFGFVALGTMLFRWGYHERAITPTEPAAYECFIRDGEPPPHYPPFNAVIYSLENFLPVVDLHQGLYWRPNPRHGSGGRMRMLSGTVLRWYLWLHILAGWVITPLFAAGLSGLVRPD